jgi:hypothetical protein
MKSMKLKINRTGKSNCPICIQQLQNGVAVAYKKDSAIVTEFIQEPLENQSVVLQSVGAK